MTPGGSNHNPALRAFTYNKTTGDIIEVGNGEEIKLPRKHLHDQTLSSDFQYCFKKC